MAPPVYHYSPNSVVFYDIYTSLCGILKDNSTSIGIRQLIFTRFSDFFLRSTAYYAVQWKHAITLPGQKNDRYLEFQKEAFLFSAG